MLDVPESRLLHPFLRLTDGMVASVGGGDALDEVQQRGPPGRLGHRSSTGRTAVPTRTSTPMPPTPVPADTSTRTPARTPVPPSRTPMEGSAPTQPQTLARAPLSAPRATRTPTTASAAPPFSRHPDRPPRSILVVNPVYPPADLKARIRGHVAIQVLVSETGAAGHRRRRARSRAPHEAAVTAVRSWRFEPATKNGQPVRAWTTVRIPFEAIPFPTPTAPTPSATPAARGD